ncbi:LexA family transcriptional regulator [Fusobacterium varium]|uniref:LexA family transcriptional regulator n=1 Tax=Fusobacterium varium TaxID=856 RepID=UPI000E404C24|nr:LexA family transcriptional regulator [Fusobacterium varium]MCI6032892.1 LexA family transcriptional regulator [Fusobacterium varium]MDY4007210.1 LexA family transcriptional regulator [Fusobacterium varium]RGJ24466.1 helix-turn-helix domain-containing protein [Fusobacterium varium]
MNFKTFLRNRREEMGYSQNKLAKAIGITQSYYNTIERGEVRNPPSEEILDKMIAILQLTTKEAAEFKYLAAIERTPTLILEELKKLEKQKDATPKVNVSELKDLDNYIPLYSRISAGIGVFTEEAPVDFISIPGVRNIETLFAVNVKGDSMEPTIKNSSIILCRKGVEVRNGEIGAFIVNEESYVKRLKVTGNYIALISDNPNYQPIYIGPGEEFSVVGKVLKVINDIQ